jgi:CRISPR-associated endonuclease Cas2
MRTNKLAKHDYQHGLVLTDKGRRRAIKAELDSLAVKTPKTWDRKWRIIFYDVPKEFKTGRDSLTRRLKQLGFYQLQRSVWVHPFKCRKEVETLSANYGIEQFVSYIETSYIDKQEVLEKKFPNILR